MKFFFNLLKSIAVLYWVLAAGIFISMLFFPKAISGLHSGYNDFAGLVNGEVVVVVDDSEPFNEPTWVSEEVALFQEAPIFVTEPSLGDKYVLADDNDDLFYSLFVYEGPDACPAVCYDDPATEEVECDPLPECLPQWVESPVSLEEPLEAILGDIWYSVETQELFTFVATPVVIEPVFELVWEGEVLPVISELDLPVEDLEWYVVEESILDGDDFATVFYVVWSSEEILDEEGNLIVVDNISWESFEVSLIKPEEAVEGDMWFEVESSTLFQAFLIEAIPDVGEIEFTIQPLSEEEFIDGLETILVYSLVGMVPYTIAVFSLSSAFEQAAHSSDPKVKGSAKSKNGKAVKVQTFGLTNLKK